jgi:hypothetical protein
VSVAAESAVFIDNKSKLIDARCILFAREE